MAHTTKENRDIYYRKAKEEGYRARSAYKLLQIFESYHILYPILDEESALSILNNSSCNHCQEQHNKFENNNDKIHENIGKSKLDTKSNLDTNLDTKPNLDVISDLNIGLKSKSNLESNLDFNFDTELKLQLESDSDSDLTDYIDIKRNCFSLGRVKNVVDLCSAPGSWSQLLRNLVYHDYITLKNACSKLKETKDVCKNLVEYLNIKPAIVAIDLQQMAPIDGVHFLKGDITDPKVLDQVSKLFLDNVSKNINQVLNGSISNKLRKNAQLITCDGAPDVSGLHETDSFLQSSLIKSALSVCLSLLDPDGYFVCKTFFGSEDTPVFTEVCAYFDYCTIFKPPASRTSSFEHFIVAMGFRPLGQILINPLTKLSDLKDIENNINSLKLSNNNKENNNKDNNNNTNEDKENKENNKPNNEEYKNTNNNKEKEEKENKYKEGYKENNKEKKDKQEKKNENEKDSYLNEIIKSITQILSGDLSPYDKLPLRKTN